MMTDSRRMLTASTLWLVSIQYFITQVIVAAAWLTPYSLRSNYISDLGNTSCGTYGGLPVCSPLHTLMNGSFILQGTTMLIGALLFASIYRAHRAAFSAFVALAISGAGTIVVGFFPENTVHAAHVLGAAMPFLVGNIALIVAGVALKNASLLVRVWAGLSGIVALIALPFLLTGHFGPLGVGGVERIVAYPQTIWLMVFGAHMLRRRLR